MPFLNLDDNFADHPKVDALSDAAFRKLVRDVCVWSRTGQVRGESVAWLLAGQMIRRAERQTLPDALVSLVRRHRQKVPIAVRRRVYARDGYACLECGATDGLTLDHIVPWSHGGSDDETNLQTLCRPCNSRKGARV